VNADYPRGAFLRPSVDGSTLEETQLRSAFVGFYWAVVSATTTGYGDIVPTSVLGRALAICCMFLGVLMLALPVTVLSANFNEAYDLLIQEHREKLTKKFAAEHVIENISESEENGDPLGFFDSPQQQKQGLPNKENYFKQPSIADLAFQSNISFSDSGLGSRDEIGDQHSLNKVSSFISANSKSHSPASGRSPRIYTTSGLILSNQKKNLDSFDFENSSEVAQSTADRESLSKDIENIDRMYREMGDAIRRLKIKHGL
jgi:hypothetical protein